MFGIKQNESTDSQNSRQRRIDRIDRLEYEVDTWKAKYQAAMKKLRTLEENGQHHEDDSTRSSNSQLSVLASSIRKNFIRPPSPQISIGSTSDSSASSLPIPNAISTRRNNMKKSKDEKSQTTTSISDTISTFLPGQEDTLQETAISNHGNENKENEEKDKIKLTILSRIVYTASTACFFAQILAAAVEQSIVAYVMGVVGIFIGPFVIIRQRRLNRSDSVRKVHNQIRGEVNRLQQENNVLTTQVDGLQEQVDKVENIEEQLGCIVQDQNTDVKDLIDLVKENGLLLKEQSKCAKAAFEEHLFTTVLRTDRNRNMKIDGHEANVLVLRMKNQEGITIDESKFRKHLKQQNSVAALMKIVQDVEKEGKGDDAILKVDMADILDSHRIMNRNVGSVINQ